MNPAPDESAKGTEMYELEITLRGPERTVETNYGTRAERDTLARLDIPVSDFKGWTIYQEAIRRALAPDVIINLPEHMSAEDAERWRKEWKKKRA